MIKFMAPVYGVTGGNVSFQFAKSRGAIHFHSVLYSKHPARLQCADALRDYAVAISSAMETVNNWIDDNYNSLLEVRITLSYQITYPENIMRRSDKKEAAQTDGWAWSNTWSTFQNFEGTFNNGAKD